MSYPDIESEAKAHPNELTYLEFAEIILKQGMEKGTTYYHLRDAGAYLQIWESDNEDHDPSVERTFVISRHEAGFGLNSIYIEFDARVKYPVDFVTSRKISVWNPSRQTGYQVIDLN